MSTDSFAEIWFTLGPASLGRERDLFAAGATGVRLTFSFGTPEMQHDRAVTCRRAAEQAGSRCFIIADLQGEKFRLGEFSGKDRIECGTGATVRLTVDDLTNPFVDGVLPVPNPAFFANLRLGSRIWVGDGSVELAVNAVSPREAVTVVTRGGVVENTRGLTIQNAVFEPRSLTDLDLTHLNAVAASDSYDAVALSFVSSRREIDVARRILAERGRHIAIIAKIETQRGVENAQEIAAAADYLMAARGDLALTTPWLELPKSVIAIADAAAEVARPWILATQVAEGTERGSFPSRAEICDLAHWRDRGCAGVLLSHETAFGAYPVEAVRCSHDLLERWPQRHHEHRRI